MYFLAYISCVSDNSSKNIPPDETAFLLTKYFNTEMRFVILQFIDINIVIKLSLTL